MIVLNLKSLSFPITTLKPTVVKEDVTTVGSKQQVPLLWRVHQPNDGPPETEPEALADHLFKIAAQEENNRTSE